MEYKKLESPEFKINTQKYEITSGMSVECVSSRESRADWCKVELTTQLQEIVTYEDMEEATVELGYDNDFDTLISGYCRKKKEDYWKEIIIRDDTIRMERTFIKATFVDCTPQDIVKYVLIQSGITEYVLCDKEYGKRETFIVDKQNGIKTLLEVNSYWDIDIDFYFINHVFYWGCSPEQKTVYILEEDENILSLNKYGDLWQVETFGVPWIHHSQELEISHSKFTGTVKVEKTVVKSDERGYTRMYIYFKGV